jgi:hypothetical protein
MAETSEDGASKELKSLAEDFLKTLGLMDLVRGGLILYWIRLWYPSEPFSLFPGTGNTVLDVALLTCGAAFAGQALSLLISSVTALIDLLLQGTRYFVRLKSSLAPHKAAPQSPLAIKEGDEIDVATYLATTSDPKNKPLLERLGARAEIGYSVGLLAIPYAIYLGHKDAPRGLIVGVGAGAVTLFIVGVLTRLDYFQELAMRVGSPPVATQFSVPKPHDGGAGENPSGKP